MKTSIFILSALLFVTTAFSQINLEEFKVKTLSPGNITEDSHGNIWFHPRMFLPGNLTLYDGEKFTIFNKDKKNGIIYNFQSVVKEDNKGTVWFGGMGLTKYDGEKWQHWFKKDGITSVFLTCLQFTDNDTINLYGTKFFYGGEFGKFYDGKYIPDASLPVKGAVSCVYEDTDKNLWYGAWKDGVYKKTGNTWTDFSKDLGFSWVTDVFEDTEGNIWVLGLEGNHAIYKDGKWEHFKYGSGYFSDQASAIFIIGILPGFIAAYAIEDKGSLAEKVLFNDEVWILVRKRGVITHRNGEIVQLNKEYNLKAPKKIEDLMKDADGNVWIINAAGYIARFDKNTKEIQVFDIPKGYFTISQDSKGTFWIAGQKKIARFTSED